MYDHLIITLRKTSLQKNMIDYILYLQQMINININLQLFDMFQK